MNGCLDKIQIVGEASAQSLYELSRDGQLEALVLIDIEGAEFELLSEEVLEILRKCSVIVEIHDFSVHEGNRKYIDLMNRAKQFFDVTTVTTTSRDLSHFPEFEDFSDHARWLLVSEGRGKRMTWLVMSPK
jgi:3-dehydroquinate dehydratase